MKKRIVIAAVTACAVIGVMSCSKAPLGTPSNPVKIWFMPLKDAAVFEANAPLIEEYLEKETGYAVETRLARSFVDIVKALGKKKADLAFVNTLGYLLAHDWAKAEALLQYVYGDLYKTYRGEIVARVDSGINGPADLNGKSFAFADPYSAGGYLYALKYLEDNKIKPSKTEFADGHIDAVDKVYRGEVNAAATFHERPSAGMARDARIELRAKYPDILGVVKIVALTDKIPNGPLAARRDLPEDVKTKLSAALVKFSRTPDGRTALMNLYNITGLTRPAANTYDGVVTVIKQLGKTIQQMVPGAEPYYRTWMEPGLD